MQYRKFGKLDWKASILGFGGFRFPIIDGDRGKVDEQETIKLLHSAIDQGVNYIGTGYLYHHGKSEVVIGKALHDGYREKVKIVTKLLISGVRTLDDCDRYLNEQLKRLQLDYVDFYLLHSLECGEPSRDQQCSWTRVRDLGILDWLEQKRSEGYIRYLGFSYHGNLEAFRRIIDECDQWTMCMILYNYIDENYQAGRQGLEYAFEKGLAVTVMEPLRGGSLVKAPLEIQALWDTASHKRTPVDWALQWIWNQPEVSVAVSGMSSIEQVKQNIASASQSGPGTLTKDELALISRVRDKYLEKTTVRCSKCQYCIPCPNGIKIPDIFSFYNETIIFDDLFGGRMRYNSWPSDDETFLLCVHC